MEIVLQNIPENIELETWTPISLPQTTPNSIGRVITKEGDELRAQIIDDILYVRAALGKGKAIEGIYKVLEEPISNDPFVFSNWITDNLSSLIPTFRASVANQKYDNNPLVFVPENAIQTPDSNIRLLSKNDIKVRFGFVTEIPDINLLISGHFDIFTGQDIVPFYIQVKYNSTNIIHLQHLYMEIGEEGVVDGAKLRSLQTNYLGNSKWTIDLWRDQIVPCPPIEITGALLCRGGRASTVEDQGRLINLLNRKEGRIIGKIK
jgi:hypothetical protein